MVEMLLLRQTNASKRQWWEKKGSAFVCVSTMQEKKEKRRVCRSAYERSFFVLCLRFAYKLSSLSGIFEGCEELGCVCIGSSS